MYTKKLINKSHEVVEKTIMLFADKKAKANCAGLLYEPKRPRVMTNKYEEDHV